jgi:hypothetical protein
MAEVEGRRAARRVGRGIGGPKRRGPQHDDHAGWGQTLAEVVAGCAIGGAELESAVPYQSQGSCTMLITGMSRVLCFYRCITWPQAGGTEVAASPSGG